MKSRPDDAGPPDRDLACEICGEDAGSCICPECPVCGVQGDPDCFVDHGVRWASQAAELKRIEMLADRALASGAAMDLHVDDSPSDELRVSDFGARHDLARAIQRLGKSWTGELGDVAVVLPDGFLIVQTDNPDGLALVGPARIFRPPGPAGVCAADLRALAVRAELAGQFGLARQLTELTFDPGDR